MKVESSNHLLVVTAVTQLKVGRIWGDMNIWGNVITNDLCSHKKAKMNSELISLKSFGCIINC